MPRGEPCERHRVRHERYDCGPQACPSTSLRPRPSPAARYPAKHRESRHWQDEWLSANPSFLRPGQRHVRCEVSFLTRPCSDARLVAGLQVTKSASGGQSERHASMKDCKVSKYVEAKRGSSLRVAENRRRKI